MFFRPAGSRPLGARLRPLLGGWWLLVLFLPSVPPCGFRRAG